MSHRTADKKFETLLQAARDLCEVRAAFAQASADGALDPERETRFSAQLRALDARLEWLKQSYSGRSTRKTPANIVSMAWAAHHHRPAGTRRLKP